MRARRKALIIGIDDYPHQKLTNCVSDAVRIAELLSRNGDGSPNFEVRTLLSSKQVVTRNILKKSINSLFDGDPDIALFYFAGHGYLDGGGGSLVSQDVTASDIGIDFSYLQSCANNSRARNRILIVDCCHSGDLNFSGTEIGTGSSAVVPEGTTVLTSCRREEASIEHDGGVFSSLLIDALSGQCTDVTGNILASSIYAYVDRALGEYNQRPTFRTNVSEFVSLRQVDPLVDINLLRKLTSYFPEMMAEYRLDPTYEHSDPSAVQDHVVLLKELQKLVGVGLVEPVNEEHMYYAAMNHGSCRLTTLGHQYWKLSKTNKL